MRLLTPTRVFEVGGTGLLAQNFWECGRANALAYTPNPSDGYPSGSDHAVLPAITPYILGLTPLEGSAELPAITITALPTIVLTPLEGSAELPAIAFSSVATLDLDPLEGSAELPAITFVPGTVTMPLSPLEGGAELPAMLFVGYTSSCHVENPVPAPDTLFWRGPDYIAWDWIPDSPVDNVRQAFITASIDNGDFVTPITGANLVTFALSPGWRCKAYTPINDGMNYTFTTTADTVSTAGSPVTVSWDFSTALDTSELLAERGMVGEFGSARLALAGLVGATGLDLLALRGIVFDLAGAPSLLVLAGGVARDYSLQDAELLALQGWITIYIFQVVAMACIVGEEAPFSALPAALDLTSFGPAATAPAAIDVTTNAVVEGLRAALDVQINDRQVAPMAVVAGPETRAVAPAAADIEGEALGTVIVVDSPSTAWNDDGEEDV